MRTLSTTRTRWNVLAPAIVLALLATAPLSASAQVADADVSIRLEVQPTSPFFQEEIDAVLTLEGTGDPIEGLTFETFGDCDGLFTGPNEVSGNGDSILESGEQWEYTCEGPVFHGVINIELSGMTGGETVTASGGIQYGAPFPISGELASSTTNVQVGEEVAWTIVVGNLGSYSLIDVIAEIRLLYENQGFPVPFDPMTGPVERDGNGDDVLDPGETWEYSYSSEIVADSRAEVNVAAAPDGAPLTRFVSTFESAVVTLQPVTSTTSMTPQSGSTLPFTGVDDEPHFLVLAMLLLMAGIGLVAATRTRS
jgi:hypothetical protein